MWDVKNKEKTNNKFMEQQIYFTNTHYIDNDNH